MAGGIKLAPLMTEIKVDIKNFKSDMEKAAAIGASEAERISKNLEDTARVGESLSKVGDILTLGVTAPLVAAGTALGKFAADSETDFAMLQGQLGTTADETERLQEVARNVYENGYGESIDDCVADLAVLRQNIRESSEWTEEMTQGTLEQIKTITTLFDTNADEVTRTAQVMKSSGLIEDISEGLDIITYGFQNGANYSGEMLDTLREYSPQFVKLGLDGSEAMQYLIQGAENGAFNLDKVGDALKELSIRVVDGSDTTKQGFEAIGKSADEMSQRFAAGGESAKQAFEDTLEGLASIEDPVQRNIAGVNLFGTMWEDLGENVILSLADVEGGLEDVEGATERAGESLNESFNTRAISIVCRLKDSLLPLGEVILDIGEDFLPKVEAGVKSFTEKLEGMDEETAQNIVQFGALAAIAGPVIKTISGGISVYTKLSSVMGGVSAGMKTFGAAQEAAVAAVKGTSAVVGHSGLTGSLVGLLGISAPVIAGVAAVGTGLYAVHESAQLAKRQVNEASEEMSLMERICAKLSGTETHTREELEQMGYVQKEFSENISPEFQKAVEDSTKKVQDFNVFLREIGFDDVITQEESDEFNSRINQTCDEVIETVKSKNGKSQSALKDMFVADDAMIDESEQKVLDILSESSDKQIAEVDRLRGEILAIKQKSVDEGRALNEQEIADIEEKNARIRQIELEAVGGTQEEIAYARNEFNARIKTLDLDAASELMQEKANIRDDEIVKIQASYDTEIEMLKSHLGEQGGANDEYLKEQIANLEKDRDDKIKIQKDLYDEYLDIIKESNPKLLDGINKFNGDVLTNEDIHSQEMLAKYSERYSGMSQITESGCYQMWNTMSNTYSDVAVVVDKKTGEIVGFHDKTFNLTAGYCQSMAQSAADMANSESASFQQIISAEGAYVDYTTGQVLLANGTAIASLGDLKSATDGTRSGIVDINGTPYEIKVNKDGTITALNEVSAVADGVANKPRTITIGVSVSNPGNIPLSDTTLSFGRDMGWFNYNGLDNVPYDGYRAVLHKGERVLTAEENKFYTNNSSIDYAKMERCMKSAVRELTMSVGTRELGRVVDEHLRERGILL